MLKLEITDIPTELKINPKRLMFLNDFKYKNGSIVYWMQREQRAENNWALLYAQELAIEHNENLIVVFDIDNEICNARQYDFMVEGLQKLEKTLISKNIPFYILKDIEKFLKEHNAGVLITDFNPLRFKLNQENKLLKNIDIPFIKVDAHNIVPVYYVSDKREYGARTLRPKIQRALEEFLTDFPALKKMPEAKLNKNNWDKLEKFSNEFKSGEKEALQVLDEFIENKLEFFSEKRNDPNEDVSSNLSSYLHFGQISAQKIAVEIIKSKALKENKEAFLEELIVRKELSDNHCYYDKNYDSTQGADNWAKTSLEKHSQDIRAYIYDIEEFENAKTHDELWNAAQMQMVKTGKMHGYLRMYWAKKILEWTKNYKQAFDIAIYLNDKYEIDGNDPNGYVGVAWSILGVHDRAWQEREVFGKVRYMSFNGCKNKFDIEKYISKVKML